MKQVEASHQIAFFQWLKLYPQINAVAWHTPNGGKRNKITALNLQKQGVKPGVPDVFIAIPVGNYKGYFIEFKTNKNKLTAHQSEMIKRLENNGYFVEVCYSWDEARKALLRYLKGSGYDVIRTISIRHNQTSS